MFSRLSVPTPFQVGPVNTYIAGRTLVDPGPDSDEAWATLLEALEERELAPTDIEQVLVTHPHPDHFGIAHRFREKGARVLASADAAEIMADFPGRLDTEQSYFVDFFERCGMAEETAKTVTKLPEAFLAYATSVRTDRHLDASDTVTVDDERVTVDAVAGHAPGEIIFAYQNGDSKSAVVGDNVLADITPNPFLQPPAESSGERPRVLPQYNTSLERLREKPFDRFLAGHREPVENPSARIDEILAEHDERTENVADVVDGPTTPVVVMNELFGDLPATEQFSGMSEAVGHLDVLEQSGRVVENQRGGVIVYEPAGN